MLTRSRIHLIWHRPKLIHPAHNLILDTRRMTPWELIKSLYSLPKNPPSTEVIETLSARLSVLLPSMNLEQINQVIYGFHRIHSSNLIINMIENFLNGDVQYDLGINLWKQSKANDLVLLNYNITRIEPLRYRLYLKIRSHLINQVIHLTAADITLIIKQECELVQRKEERAIDTMELTNRQQFVQMLLNELSHKICEISPGDLCEVLQAVVYLSMEMKLVIPIDMILVYLESVSSYIFAFRGRSLLKSTQAILKLLLMHNSHETSMMQPLHHKALNQLIDKLSRTCYLLTAQECLYFWQDLDRLDLFELNSFEGLYYHIIRHLFLLDEYQLAQLGRLIRKYDEIFSLHNINHTNLLGLDRT